MSALRKPTNPNAANAEGSPYADSGATRNCMKCGLWRPQGGGRINKRTRMWNCAGCLPKEVKA
jgi:hypothetical protein